MSNLQPNLDRFTATNTNVGQEAEMFDLVSHKPLHVNKATFKGGLDAPAHRWFRLTPSFGPSLVDKVLNEFGASTDSVVLDPFTGAGTTQIECKLQGISSFGFEINPFLHFVSSNCVDWGRDYKEGCKNLKNIEDHFLQLSEKLRNKDLELCDLEIPPIHNVYRWWRKDVLKEMLILKASIDNICKKKTWRDFFRLALAGVLVPDLTNVTLGRLQLFFIDREEDCIEAWPIFKLHCDKMLEDLYNVSSISAKSSIFHTDATNPIVDGEYKADFVITSPPYPNRYSYVWNTRPHLYLLDFFKAKDEASGLDKKTIGGTWGTATSILNKGIIAPAHDAVDQAASRVVEQIREQDNMMANYVMKYFNMLMMQIVAMAPYLKSGAKVAYVVGNSRSKGVYIETDVILAQIFEGLGYNINNIERFRKRNSGVDLYETIVFATKK